LRLVLKRTEWTFFIPSPAGRIGKKERGKLRRKNTPRKEATKVLRSKLGKKIQSKNRRQETSLSQPPVFIPFDLAAGIFLSNAAKPANYP